MLESPSTSVLSFGDPPEPILPLVLAITISSVVAVKRKMPSTLVFLSLLVVAEV